MKRGLSSRGPSSDPGPANRDIRHFHTSLSLGLIILSPREALPLVYTNVSIYYTVRICHWKKWSRNSGHPPSPSRKTIFEHVLRALKNVPGVDWDIYCAKYGGGFMCERWHEMSWSHQETSTANPILQTEINTEQLRVDPYKQRVQCPRYFQHSFLNLAKSINTSSKDN